MSANVSALQAIAADLRNAGNAGGTRLAQSTVANGRASAELGAAVRLPGRGLSELTGKPYVVANPNGDVADVVAHMAVELADGGVDLALGRRR